jgi:Zn-dependent peptidase ImmA (M78 family)
MFSEKLKLARLNSGLSLRDLQSKIGNKVSAQAIGKYERGEMSPSPDILFVLANALGVSEKYLLEKTTIHLGAIEFRENFIQSKKEKAQVETTILREVANYLEIEELLQVETAEWEQPHGFPYQVSDSKDVEWIAYKVREEWRLGSDPIQNFSEFLEDRGIKVIFHSFPDSVSGISCWVHRKNLKKVPTILVNNNITGERQRFTLAHELGHLLLEMKNSHLNVEPFCNRFAGAFLIPESVLLTTLGKHRNFLSVGELVSLKKIFKVSIQAIVYRCKDLNIISQSSFSHLFQEFTRLGWRNPPYPEPLPLDSEKSDRFERLCYRALKEKAASEDKVSDLLGIPIEKIRDKMDKFPDSNVALQNS